MSQRIVCIGDSITDGFAWPLLVRQALERANRPVPQLINAGVCGDTAAGVNRRLERDVHRFHPDAATLSIGINDLIRNVPLSDYDAEVDSILAELRRARISVIVMTLSVLSPDHEEACERIVDFNMALRRQAREYGHRLADVAHLMEMAVDRGEEVLETDGIHPNFRGHQLMAQAVLNAMDYPDVPVPDRLALSPLPGVIRKWQVKAIDEGDPERPYVTPANIDSLQPDYRWFTLNLPEAKPLDNWWQDQIRQEGYAVSLTRLIAPAPRFIAVTAIDIEEPGERWLNLGGYLRAIWLDGQNLYQNDGQWRGYHAGRERIQLQLQRGHHRLLIETGPQFFLSLTPTPIW